MNGDLSNRKSAAAYCGRSRSLLSRVHGVGMTSRDPVCFALIVGVASKPRQRWSWGSLRSRNSSHDSGPARLNPINPTERKNSAEHLAPRAFFAEPHNSENGSDHWQEISEGAQLRGFQIAQQPE